MQRRNHDDAKARFADGFGGPTPVSVHSKGGIPAKRRPATPPPVARRSQRFNGFGMLALATLFLTLGGWMGSQVQAYALGFREPVHQVDPNEMKPVPGPAFTF